MTRHIPTLLQLTAALVLLWLALLLSIQTNTVMGSLRVITDTNAQLANTNASLAKAVLEYRTHTPDSDEQLAAAQLQLDALVAQQKAMTRLAVVQEQMRVDLARYLARHNDTTNVNIARSYGSQ
jgi:hypothetical protein